MCCVLFSFSLSLIDRTMAPKAYKSTPTRNLLQGSRSSSSNPVPLLHIRLHDEKAQKDFLENFQKRGIHSECQVIPSNFADTPLLTVIRTRGWESLLERHLRCPVVFIQKFYSNIHGINTSIPQFAITFRGTRIVVTLDLISEVQHIPKVAHPDYLGCERLRTMSRDELLSHFYETPSNTLCSSFAKGPRFLNMVMTFTLTPLSHYNSITESRARFLLSLLEDLSIDFPSHFITSILDVYLDTTTRDKLIFPSAITQILQHFHIPIPDSPFFTTMGAISADSVRQSETQLRPKRLCVEIDDPVASAFPPSFSALSTSTPSSSTADVTLEANNFNGWRLTLVIVLTI